MAEKTGARQERNDRHSRVVFLPVPSKDWSAAAMALTHEAKNLYNTTVFAIRQISSAYHYDGEGKVHVLKDDLHDNQRQALEAFNAHISTINAKRRAKCKADDEPKLITDLEPRMSASPLSAALNVTLLDNVVRNWPDERGQAVYRRLPASSAQQVVRSVIDMWKASLAAIRDWSVHPEKYTGRPQLPGFLPKDGHFPLEIPFASITKGFPRPKVLGEVGDLGKRSEELQSIFYDHDLRSSVDVACRARGWDVFQPRHIRIVEKGGRIVIEAVVDLVMAFPEGSFLRKVYDKNGDALRDMQRVSERERFIIAKANEDFGDIRIAGVDFGESNVAAMAFSTGHRAVVHSGERPIAIARKYQALLDARIAELASPRMKELQAKQAAFEAQGLRLGKAEHVELRREQARIFRDPLYRSLVSNLSRKNGDYEHKVTTDLVRQCLRNGIDVIVVGQNKGLKSDGGRGRRANRQSHSIAHHRLLALLRYKAERHGIAVVTTEESYTSKTSFVDNDELRMFGDKTKGRKNTTTETVDDTASQDTDAPAVVHSGHRSTRNRNWFIRHNAAGRLAKVHADVNGAFNIIRKVFKGFCHHAGLSLKFNLRRVSPRLGAVPLFA